MRCFSFLLTLLFIVTSVTPALSQNFLKGPVKAEVLFVVDGDTLRARAHIWLKQTIDVSVRIRGIDAAELKARCPLEKEFAEKARDRLRNLLFGSGKTRRVMLHNISGGKYFGRVLAHIVMEDGEEIGKKLLDENLVRPYAKDRRDWC